MKTTPNYQQNIHLLKQNLKELNLDYFLLPNSDEFGSEYLPDYAKRLEFITGFSGSNAFVIIGQKKSAFFTDGRYTIQAKKEVDSSIFEIFNLANKSPLLWLLEQNELLKIGFDSKLHNINFVVTYKQNFEENLIALDKNLVDEIWQNQPKFIKSKIFKHPIKYCGISSKTKINKIIADLDNDIDALIITDPASICWLFNIRAADIEYSPLLLSYAIIDKNGNSEFFHQSLPKIVQSNQKLKIQLDFNQTNHWLYQILQQHNIVIVNKTNPCLAKKAIKNKVEINNAIIAHKIDGLAVTKFLFWLKTSIEQNHKIDELSASKKLLEFRKANKKFFYPSFATIAGFGSNGAIIHYHSSQKTNKTIRGNSLFLIDSGGQYLEGTTDITRTIAVGTPSKVMIENFTRVLKGHIAIARAKFPQGTKGSDLDALARYHLWQSGIDYEHGTGHGVGSFSSVHEAPPSISKRGGGVALQEGMILSNEPGYYEDGKYGIRIENLMIVEKTTQTKLQKKLKKQFLQFQTISLAPIDNRLIDFAMLTYPEKKWLNKYHLKIYETLKSELNEKEQNWLENLTKK